VNRICWLMFVTSCLNAGPIYESLNYVSQPVPAWADFTVRGERLLDFQSSDTTGRFSIEIPGVPRGAIVDDGFIVLYGGMSTSYGEDSRGAESVNGGFTWVTALDYNGASASLGSYVAGSYSLLEYTGAGTLTGNWEVAYGWPGTDLEAFGPRLGPETKIRKAASVEFQVQADIVVNYHFAPVPEPATLGFSLAGLGLIAAGNYFAKIRKSKCPVLR
jgi:PEP-CTERM motif